MGISTTALSEQKQASKPQGNKGSGVYEIVTKQILALLEKGTIPWKRPWSLVTGDEPMNVRGNLYRGANYFLLSALDYDRPIFLTFRQAIELGGNVRRGEKGFPVVYWKLLEARNDDNEDQPDGAKPKLIPFLRYYTVFNISQCEGLRLPERLKQTLHPPPDFDPITAAEAIWTNYPNPPRLRYFGSRAAYNPTLDEIRMPPKHAFESREAYYCTLFHEMGHSTGHKTRLNREFAFNSGSQTYAREELTAEMTSAFLCARAGISQPVLENQAAYLAFWSKSLTDDPKLFVVAAGRAQKAADYILGVKATEESEPVTDICA